MDLSAYKLGSVRGSFDSDDDTELKCLEYKNKKMTQVEVSQSKRSNVMRKKNVQCVENCIITFL